MVSNLKSLAMRLDPVQMARYAGIELDPWQSKLVRSQSNRILLNCSRQSGKALSVDTEIPTPDGWTLMGELSPGDLVFDEQGQSVYVTWCSPITERPVYRVSFSDGSEIIADADHLWTTLDAAARSAYSRTTADVPEYWFSWESEGRPIAKSRLLDDPACSFMGCDMVRIANGLCAGHNAQQKKGKVLTSLQRQQPKAKTITTKEMLDTLTYYKKRGDVNHAIPSTKPLDLPSVDLPIDPYTLGAWLGDGHSADARITAHEDDSAIFEEISNAGYQVARHDYKDHVPTWSIRGLFRELRLSGLLNNKHIPSIYLRASTEQRIAMLQGLMDTDGCGPSETHQGTCEFTTTSEQLAHDVYELMTSLGLVVRIKKSDAKLYGRVVSQKWRLFFCPWFVPFRLARKVDQVHLDGPRKGLRKLRFVTGIEPAGITQVRCISVSSPSKLYLAGRAMVPTHNSTTVSVIADHTAFYEDDSPILLLSPSLRQSGELFRKCLDVYRALGKPVAADAENKLSLELENGSRIVSLPGKEGTTRGFSGVKLLIIDEASQVPDELYMSVKPMLAVSGGRMIVLSSPFGTRGFFYDIYKSIMEKLKYNSKEEEHRNDWEYYEVPATECPRISPEFLESEREEMGDWWFQQEYMCKFMDSATAAFRSEDIQQIVKPNLEVWDI